MTTMSNELSFPWILGKHLYLSLKRTNYVSYTPVLTSGIALKLGSDDWQVYTLNKWILHECRRLRYYLGPQLSCSYGMGLPWWSRNRWLFSKSWNIHLISHKAVNFKWFSHLKKKSNHAVNTHLRRGRSQTPLWKVYQKRFCDDSLWGPHTCFRWQPSPRNFQDHVPSHEVKMKKKPIIKSVIYFKSPPSEYTAGWPYLCPIPLSEELADIWGDPHQESI